MSADDWVQCPKGCKSDGAEEDATMRVDYRYGIDVNGARFYICFECQACDLKVVLEQEKKPKQVIKELSFD